MSPRLAGALVSPLSQQDGGAFCPAFLTESCLEHVQLDIQSDSRCCLQSFLELLLYIVPICLTLWPANSSHLSCFELLVSVSSAHQDQEYPMGSGMGQ